MCVTKSHGVYAELRRRHFVTVERVNTSCWESHWLLQVQEDSNTAFSGGELLYRSGITWSERDKAIKKVDRPSCDVDLKWEPMNTNGLFGKYYYDLPDFGDGATVFRRLSGRASAIGVDVSIEVLKRVPDFCSSLVVWGLDCAVAVTSPPLVSFVAFLFCQDDRHPPYYVLGQRLQRSRLQATRPMFVA